MSAPDDLDVVDTLLERARRGEDVRAALSLLPPELRAQVEDVLDGARRMLAAAAPVAPPPPPSRRGSGRASARLDQLLGAELSGCVLERLLGRGGMGAAYLARRVADGRAVVVKLLAPAAASSDRLRARLAREAAALRRIRAHPSLVAVLGADIEGLDGDPPHLVLEYARGATLREVVTARGPLPWEEVARAGIDLARGLAVIHGHGLLHRDVKPDNVVVDAAGRARLIDLGIAKDLFVTGLTEVGELLGSAETMAPEQWTGDAQDPRTDVFGLGATLYHALCGRPAFTGALDEVQQAATEGTLIPPRALAPACPPDLQRVLLCALDPAPRFRYPRMEPLAADLERVARGAPPRGVPALVEDAPPRRVHPLVPGRRFLVGRALAAEVRLDDPAVSREHAEVRREATGFRVRDLGGPGGTLVGDEPVVHDRLLEDGDVVRVGQTRLTLLDAGGRRRPPAFLEDLERAEVGEALVVALVLERDPRALADLLERLAPDPLADRVAAAALDAVAGPEAPRLLARRAALAAAARAGAPALLEAVSGVGLGADPVAWLGWWLQERGRLAAQVGLARPARVLRLGDALLLAAAGEPGVLLLGRDARCHLRVDDGRASRLHATVVRLHRRLVVRDEGSAAGTHVDGAPVHVAFLDPGATLTLGGPTVAVAGDEVEARGPSGQRLVDAWTFQALEEVNHPSTARAHVDLLAAAADAPARLAGAAKALAPDDPARAQALARRATEAWTRRAERSRAALGAALGRDEGASAAAWRAVLRVDELGPQVAPAGWFEG